jgi:hypothetical protein
MQTLTTETQQNLADLINTIEVCELMSQEFRAEENIERAVYWRTKRYSAVISLYDDYGIKLPTYDIAVEFNTK